MRTDWPIALIVLFMLYVQLMQSSHPWNNTWFATNRWFPYDGKTFELVANYNMAYIQQNQQTIPVADFYFTNQDVFKGAKNTRQAFFANPRFFIEQMGKNMVISIPILAEMTAFPPLTVISICLPLLGAAMIATRSRHLKIFIIGSISMIGITAIYPAQLRYLFPLIPLYLLSAHWYAEKINRFVSRYTRSQIALLIAPTILLILFSRGTQWLYIFRAARGDQKQMHLMTRQDLTMPSSLSLRRSYSQLKEEASSCQGITTLEHTFITAFIDLPVTKIHDVWEIPPFGELGNPEYAAFAPDTIDCLFISHQLEFGTGIPTNHTIRYRNYILPYAEYLQSTGGIVIEIPPYGRLIRRKITSE